MKKTVTITGATSGIGLETTRLLAGKGYCILAGGSRPCEHGHREQNNRDRGFCVEIPQTLRSASIRPRAGLFVPVQAMRAAGRVVFSSLQVNNV